MPTQSFIFDFNGTLFLDSPIHLRAWQIFLGRYGIDVTEALFHRYMCGPPNSDILRHFLGDQLSKAEVDALAEAKELVYREIVSNDPSLQRLAPGAPEMLDMLAEKGVPFAIATGSIKSNVDFYMDVLKIDRWFDYDHVFYAEEKLPGKPDPAVYREAMKKLRFDIGHTTVVEDAMAGIQSATGAGIKSIIAIDTTLGAEAFRGIPEVRAIIHDYYGFERFLEG